jgi:Ribonuclease HI
MRIHSQGRSGTGRQATGYGETRGGRKAAPLFIATMNKTIEIKLYTDGACSCNPGNGGVGYVAVMDGKPVFESERKGYRQTTNNRMEILAAIKGLGAMMDYIKDTLNPGRDTDIKVTVFSDSQVVIKTMNEGWKRKQNSDLWQKLDERINTLELNTTHIPYRVKVSFEWTKGHADDAWNNQADLLAKAASKVPVLKDAGYESIIAYKLVPRPCVEPVPEPEIRDIRLLNHDKLSDRKVEVALTDGTVITIVACHEGFEQYGGTQREHAVTVDVAWRFAEWLHGKSF